MNQADLAPFSKALADMLSALSHGKHTPEAGAVRVWFRTLQPYPLQAVLAGMDSHMRTPSTGRTLPIPSDIVAQIVGAAANDGRPDGDEAWAIVAPAASEAVTVVWSDEMAEAWGVVLPLVTEGDMVAARKSFLSVYGRLVIKAREHRKGLRWIATLGQDKASQADAIRIAAQQGRIAGGPASDVLALAALPAPDARLLMLGLVDTREKAATPETKAKAIAALQTLRAHLEEKEDRSGLVDDRERQATNAMKRRSADAVAAFGEAA